MKLCSITAKLLIKIDESEWKRHSGYKVSLTAIMEYIKLAISESQMLKQVSKLRGQRSMKRKRDEW